MQNGDCWWLLHQIQTDLLDSAAFHAESLCGSIGDVDDSAVYHRATVIHANNDGAAVADVGDLNVSPERQHGMGRGEVVHVISFAACGFLALEIASVPGRRPYLIRLGLPGNLRLGGWFRPRS